MLERAQAELLDFQGRGLSVMEMSHRSDEFVAIAERAEADFRHLLGVPDNYRVLFFAGRGQHAVRHAAHEPVGAGWQW
ncbi:hypothetical protein HSBAA_28770 [Vreelandella sulfidaeris]|uniref:Phosphoserine aminotransferase n=1 Tax=Vreelandella sulfidaeris TaxID=115553 RepID=A0A455UAG6_9GAMM|nr:hypothetical protein HSBAA_28770 [Halomonas sulfidaeris]